MRVALLLPCLLLACLLLAPAPAWPQEDDPPQVEEDPLSLVALLIRDGYWDRAAKVLDDIDPEGDGLDTVRHRTLLGLVRLRQGRLEEAVNALQEAQALGSTEPLVPLYLGQALLDLGRPSEAYAALVAAGELAETLPAAWFLRARAAKEARLADEAWSTLMEAQKRFPERADDFALRQVLLLVDLQLYRNAVLIGRELLARRADDPEPWVAVGESLRKAGQPAEAARLLEEARLRFPQDGSIPLRLAGALVAAERPLACAVLLEQESLSRPELALEAAECYRRAGSLGKALQLNSRVPDTTRRYQQRLGLLVEAQDWGRAALLEPRLRREGLLADDDVAYALGYAFFELADYDQAVRLLRGIADPEVFERATKLREAIARCEAEPLRCG